MDPARVLHSCLWAFRDAHPRSQHRLHVCLRAYLLRGMARGAEKRRNGMRCAARQAAAGGNSAGGGSRAAAPYAVENEGGAQAAPTRRHLVGGDLGGRSCLSRTIIVCLWAGGSASYDEQSRGRALAESPATSGGSHGGHRAASRKTHQKRETAYQPSRGRGAERLEMAAGGVWRTFALDNAIVRRHPATLLRLGPLHCTFSSLFWRARAGLHEGTPAYADVCTVWRSRCARSSLSRTRASAVIRLCACGTASSRRGMGESRKQRTTPAPHRRAFLPSPGQPYIFSLPQATGRGCAMNGRTSRRCGYSTTGVRALVRPVMGSPLGRHSALTFNCYRRLLPPWYQRRACGSGIKLAKSP